MSVQASTLASSLASFRQSSFTLPTNGKQTRRPPLRVQQHGLTTIASFLSRWIMPLAGLIVGYATNYLALKMIFSPIDPHYCCCGRVKIHGLFLQRQYEVAAMFAQVNVRNVLNSRHMWMSMLEGKVRTLLFAGALSPTATPSPCTKTTNRPKGRQVCGLVEVNKHPLPTLQRKPAPLTVKYRS